jgi:putative ABC transport system permease protein
MGVLKSKILRDLWSNKGRTIQVMLIIGIGAAAVGMIMTTRNLVVPGMQSAWQRFKAPMITMFVDPPVNQNDLDSLVKIQGVAEMEGLNNTSVEWRVNPTDEWKSGGLTARSDYNNMKMDKMELVEGQWPHDKIVLIGQGDDKFFGLPKNGKVYLRIDNKIYTVEVGGVLYNQFQQPATFGGNAQFYASIDEYDYLVGNRDFSQILILGNFPYVEKQATALADAIKDRLEKGNRNTGRMITDPNKHFFQDSMNGLFMLLGVLAVLALILGLLLVYTTINSIILGQVDQIGVMKAIGARALQIITLYLVVVLIYGFLALLLALPLGMLGGWAISSWLTNSFGAKAGSFQYDQQAVIAMALIALFAPLVAALIPIWSAACITVREAISTYGLNTNTGLLEKILARAVFISRTIIITISNTFRHKGRVILLQIALVLSGLVFMMVISVRDSVVYTVKDVLFAILNANITLVFQNAERIDHVEHVTMQYPGIKAVEMWGLSGPTIRPRGKKASDDDKQMTMFGVPLPTELYGYQLRAGRWLQQGDNYAMVLNQKLAKDIGVTVGDWVTVKYGNKNERDWQIVGLVFDPILTQSGSVPRGPMLNDLGTIDRAPAIWIQTEQTGVAAESAIAKGLRKYYTDLGIKVAATRGIFGMGDSTAESAAALINQFNFLVVLLAIMAVLIGAVGSIALSGALALSVMERRREIGVMRAIGASSWSIFRLFVGEGLILGWLSWLIAFPIAIPAGKLMVYALGQAFNLEIVYHYTSAGQVLWLAIITILSILASWLPARGATRISVRESLAYQ